MQQSVGSVFGGTVKQLGGLVKHVAKRVAAEPLELLKTMSGQRGQAGREDNAALEALEQGGQAGTGGTNSRQSQLGGFKTKQDYQRYRVLSGKKDEMELAILRKKLAREWGVEAGMERARQEFAEKEKQRKKVEEQKKEEGREVRLEQRKKEEDIQVMVAKQAASAERRMAVG